MYSSADFSITPRPLYRSDGLKTFDVHSHPSPFGMRLNKIWENSPSLPSGVPGPDCPPANGLQIGKWMEEERISRAFPGLPAPLDYDLQRYGPSSPQADQAVQELDRWWESCFIFMSLKKYG
jgi:hypothetical protein